MKLYDIVKWDPTEAEANEWVCHKHEVEDFNTHTQLIVHQSQEAVFYKDGRALDLFGAGEHTLKSDNIPLLKKLISIPTDGETPFHCEIYFVNKVFQMDMKWGTASPIQTEDPVYGILVNVGASGTFGAEISDSRKFLTKVVGTRAEFTRTELSQYLRAAIVMNIKDALGQIMMKNKISFLQATTEIKNYSEQVKTILEPIFEEFGIRIIRFDWATLAVPSEDLKPLKDAKNRAVTRAVEGYTYQQEKGFDVMRTAAGNQGMAGTMMGAGMGLGMGVGVGAPIGMGMGELAKNTMGGFNANAATNAATNTGNATNGAVKGATCPKCGAAVPANAKFCPDCGEKLANAKKFCMNCGNEIPSGSKFCPNCGEKVQ